MWHLLIIGSFSITLRCVLLWILVQSSLSPNVRHALEWHAIRLSPCSLPILASDWLTTFKYRHISIFDVISIIRISPLTSLMTTPWRSRPRHNSSISSALAMEIRQSGTKPSTFRCRYDAWMINDKSYIILLNYLHSAWNFDTRFESNAYWVIFVSVPTKIDLWYWHVDRGRHFWRHNYDQQSVISPEFDPNVMPKCFTQPFPHGCNTLNELKYLRMRQICCSLISSTDTVICPDLASRYHARLCYVSVHSVFLFANWGFV